MPAAPVAFALILCSVGPGADDRPTPHAAPAGAAEAAPGDAHVRFAEALLNGWEATTADRVPVSAADRAAARWARPTAPAELLDLAADLRGPIDADALKARYRWRAESLTTPVPRLVAVPRDPLARAFTPRLTVRLAEDFSPLTVAVAPPAGGPAGSGGPAGGEVVRVAATSAAADRPSVTPPAAKHAAVTPAAAASAAARPPVRTAQFVRPDGGGPLWKIERRVKTAPPTRLTNAPAPRAE